MNSEGVGPVKRLTRTTISVLLDDRPLFVTLHELDESIMRLVELRLSWYLARNAPAILGDLQIRLRRPLSAEFTASLVGSADPVRDHDHWHEFLPTGEQDGLRTAERVLVQMALVGLEHLPLPAWHDLVCPILERRVDPTFVCALELL